MLRYKNEHWNKDCKLPSKAKLFHGISQPVESLCLVFRVLLCKCHRHNLINKNRVNTVYASSSTSTGLLIFLRDKNFFQVLCRQLKQKVFFCPEKWAKNLFCGPWQWAGLSNSSQSLFGVSTTFDVSDLIHQAVQNHRGWSLWILSSLSYKSHDMQLHLHHLHRETGDTNVRLGTSQTLIDNSLLDSALGQPS